MSGWHKFQLKSYNKINESWIASISSQNNKNQSENLEGQEINKHKHHNYFILNLSEAKGVTTKEQRTKL